MKVYVGNLPKQMTSAELNDLAVPFGSLQSATVVTERTTGESRGFGFIEFNSAEEAKAAIAALNGKDVSGSVLKVNEAKPKEARPSR
jgi:RNA recognition motif-containing protein